MPRLRPCAQRPREEASGGGAAVPGTWLRRQTLDGDSAAPGQDGAGKAPIRRRPDAPKLRALAAFRAECRCRAVLALRVFRSASAVRTARLATRRSSSASGSRPPTANRSAPANRVAALSPARGPAPVSTDRRRRRVPNSRYMYFRLHSQQQQQRRQRRSQPWPSCTRGGGGERGEEREGERGRGERGEERERRSVRTIAERRGRRERRVPVGERGRGRIGRSMERGGRSTFYSVLGS